MSQSTSSRNKASMSMPTDTKSNKVERLKGRKQYLQIRKILIVEDNPGDAVLLQKYIQKAFPEQKIEFDRVSTLKQMADQLGEDEYSLITLDLNLPDAEGLESVKSVRKRCPDTAVIVISGQDDLKTAQNALRLGAQDFLVKGNFSKNEQLRWTVVSAIERQNKFNLLNVARSQAVMKNQIKDQILSMTAHDIRSPLAGVVGFLNQIIEGEFGDEVSTDQKRIFQLMLRNCEEVLHLANDIVDAKRTNSELFEIQPTKVDVPRFLFEFVQAYREIARKTGIQIRVDSSLGPKSAVFDKSLITRALQNLVSNAIRVSGSSKCVQINCTINESSFSLSVSDEGPGIDEAYFERFLAGVERGESAANTDQQKIMGLGLMIVQKIALSHNGRLTVVNRKKKSGATFSIEIAQNWNNEIKLERPY